METVREAAVDSASASSRSSPRCARSRARASSITSVSQTAVASLIELQSDMLTSAISAAALRLERASRADNIVELVREQFEMIPATRDRLVEDAHRAALIFKHAGRDLRGVATNLYERVVETAEEKHSRGDRHQAQGQARRSQDQDRSAQDCEARPQAGGSCRCVNEASRPTPLTTDLP